MKKILAVTIALFLAIAVTIPAYASKKKSTYNPNRCAVSGCSRNKTSGSIYCSSHKCTKSGCKARRSEDSCYCSIHKDSCTKSSGSKSSYKKHTYHDSYDDGWEDIYDNEDYDEERYKTDSDYASGVDDAMDEFNW